MKISVLAVGLAMALALPVAAQAANCGVPQGYGTTNPYVPNSGAANLGSNTSGN